jgi:hypothetical protein
LAQILMSHKYLGTCSKSCCACLPARAVLEMLTATHHLAALTTDFEQVLTI